MKNNSFKKLATGRNIQKLLLFLSAFFAPFALAMDKKTPKSLVYLASLKVNHHDLHKAPTALAEKASAIRIFDSELKRKIKSAENTHYQELLENICTKKRVDFTIEDIYKFNPSLVVSEHENLFNKCILNDNRAEAEWLVTEFPSLLDCNLPLLLKESIRNGHANSFNLLTDKLYKRTPPKLHSELRKAIMEYGKKYKKPVAVWLSANQIPYSEENKFLHALAIKDLGYIKEHARCLDQIVNNEEHHVILKGLFKGLVASGHARDILTILSKNSDFIQLVQPEIRSLLLDYKITNLPHVYTQLLQLCATTDQPVKDHLTWQLGLEFESNLSAETTAAVTQLIKYGANPCQLIPLNQFQEPTILPVVYVMEEFDNHLLEEKRKIVQILLSKNPQEQINRYKAQNSGNNLLYCKNSHDYIDILTSAGCNINELNRRGVTPLHNLIMGWQRPINLAQAVERFLFYGADPYANSNNGNNLLWLLEDESERIKISDLPNKDEIRNLLFGSRKLTWGMLFKQIIGKSVSPVIWNKQKAHPFENATMKIDSNKTITAPRDYNTELSAILQKSALAAVSKSQTITQKHQVARMENID